MSDLVKRLRSIWNSGPALEAANEIERLEGVVDSADRVANGYLRELMTLKQMEAVVEAAREFVETHRDIPLVTKALRKALKELDDK